ncbi:RimK family alpha-L-glutamate ligase [Zavarzinella formosa]|uniref:RimK family alpha-L-glutamate ligase n=1 Tax=Zavarzinella formosa TaxID=360055 RepID=UPI0002EBF7A4|nr:RimK family alpha-L-glutamate ligase [Zavarzinella formosa]
MRIAILSGGDGWHVRDLQRAASALGHVAESVDFRNVSAHVPAGHPCAELANYDGVIVRTMPPGSLEQVVFRMDVLQALEARGIPVLNPAKALESCVDKYLALERLRQHGLPVPETIVCQQADAAMAVFEGLGRDVVVKPIFGSEGRGLMRITDPELAWRAFRAIERTDAVLYLQKFIPHPGWDLRAFVLNGRVIAAMKRTANNDWRTNVAQGAKAEAVTLTSEQTKLALDAAKAVGTIAAGVDLLPGPAGAWYVVEVNAVPGWKSLAPTTGIDVASLMIQAIEKMPESRLVNAESRTRSSMQVQTACMWEVLAQKAGNVHPGARFRDMTHLDFLMSGMAIAPVLGNAVGKPLGETILEAIRATRRVVRCNTNLGIALLLAPLAAVPETDDLRAGLIRVLEATTVQDSVNVYEAIRLAVPGGLGEAPDQDVRKQPTLPFREVMAMAANYDQIAAEYANGFLTIFQLGVPMLLEGLQIHGRLERAIQYLQLRWLATHEDTLISRKRGPVIARETSRQARDVLANGGPGSPAYAEFDHWLRADGNARNPGTTADLITACLYVALRQRTLTVDTPW